MLWIDSKHVTKDNRKKNYVFASYEKQIGHASAQITILVLVCRDTYAKIVIWALARPICFSYDSQHVTKDNRKKKLRKKNSDNKISKKNSFFLFFFEILLSEFFFS